MPNQKKNQYDLDAMIKRFEEDWIKAEKHNAQMKSKYKMFYPDETTPSYFDDDFYVSHALMHICKEIKALKGHDGPTYD